MLGLQLRAVVKPRDEIVGTVYGKENGKDVPVLFLVVRGDCAGFVFEAGGADFFEIIGDGSDLEAVEAAMQRAEQALRDRRDRTEAGRGGPALPC